MKDLGIVHLTDLHYPEAGRPNWAAAIIGQLQDVGRDGTVEIGGVAVTGDLVSTPNEEAFRNVRRFLDEIAQALNLKKNGDWWNKLWLVDGNHDYRRDGWGGSVNKDGIELGRHLRRHHFEADLDLQVLVAGLNSCESGRFARGAVAHTSLVELDKKIQKLPGSSNWKLRIALVHHHLLTLPSKPADNSGVIARFRRLVYDEGTKLLENSALVARQLLDMGFDLVLHGHEHQPFAATVSHVESDANRVMAVLGGASADQGFQLIRLRSSGEVTFERFNYREQGYQKDPARTLWSSEDWRRLEWERERVHKGWYERYELRKDLDVWGDLVQEHELTDIHGPEGGQIEKVLFSVEANPAKLGFCTVDRIYDKSSNHEFAKTSLPKAGTKIEQDLKLTPPARINRPHKGYATQTRLFNSFAVTSLDARLRDHSAEEETFLRVAYPVRRVTLVMRYPDRGVPTQRPKVSAIDTSSGEVDLSETSRIADRLVFNEAFGVAVLDFQWVLPRFRYHLSWQLPEVLVADDAEEANIAQEQVRELIGLAPGVRDEFDAKFRELRDHICATFLGCKHAHKNEVNLALWVFDRESSCIRFACGTYDKARAERAATMPWGYGVHGSAMRRRHPAFVDTKERRGAIYRPLEGCDTERYLLCVPVPFPYGNMARGRAQPDPLTPCAIASLSARTAEGNLGRLKSVELCEQVSSLTTKKILTFLTDVGGEEVVW